MCPTHAVGKTVCTLFGFFERGFNRYLFELYIARALVSHNSGYFFDKLAEFLHSRLFVAQYRDFMLDERMVEHENVFELFHLFFLRFVFGNRILNGRGYFFGCGGNFLYYELLVAVVVPAFDIYDKVG